MLKIEIVSVLVFVCTPGSVYVFGQVQNNVRVIDHREYMVEVIQETVREVERRGWCNLKLSDIVQDINEDVINWHLSGHVLYTHGFAVSIHHIDVRRDTLNQVWSNVGDSTVQVNIQGQLRMTELSLGYDVVATLADGVHHYTAVMTHPLVTFDFSIIRNVHTHSMTVSVRGNQPATSNRINILPADRISDALVTLFNSNSTFYGVTAWAEDVFQPIALNVVNNIVPFPGLCYNCPVT